MLFSGEARAVYESSPGVGRGFCRGCGTPLTWEGVSTVSGHPIIELHMGTLDDPETFAPAAHWLHPERLPWFEVADDLPRFRGKAMPDEEPYAHGPQRMAPVIGKPPGDR